MGGAQRVICSDGRVEGLWKYHTRVFSEGRLRLEEELIAIRKVGVGCLFSSWISYGCQVKLLPE